MNFGYYKTASDTWYRYDINTDELWYFNIDSWTDEIRGWNGCTVPYSQAGNLKGSVFYTEEERFLEML